MSVGLPAGAGWRVSESVPNDSKVIELNTGQGIDQRFLKQFISSSFNISQIQLGSVAGLLDSTPSLSMVYIMLYNMLCKDYQDPGPPDEEAANLSIIYTMI